MGQVTPFACYLSFEDNSLSIIFLYVSSLILVSFIFSTNSIAVIKSSVFSSCLLLSFTSFIVLFNSQKYMLATISIIAPEDVVIHPISLLEKRLIIIPINNITVPMTLIITARVKETFFKNLSVFLFSYNSSKENFLEEVYV